MNDPDNPLLIAAMEFIPGKKGKRPLSHPHGAPQAAAMEFIPGKKGKCWLSHQGTPRPDGPQWSSFPGRKGRSSSGGDYRR